MGSRETGPQLEPRYNLSPQEAVGLAEYFAAADGQPVPAAPAVPTAAWLEAPQDRQRMDQAMSLMTDRNLFCAKCHVIGDYRPSGAAGTIVAPDLAQVGRRLQSGYVRRWLAHPKKVLPYTPMPVNFPPTGEPLGQDLLPGRSLDQVDAISRLLLHYDDYLRDQVSIGRRVGSPVGERRPASGAP